MKIGIELNNVVRDLNSQILKYYKKDIDRGFDDENIDLNVVDFAKKLPFETKKARNNFLYIDYAYEIFGCAPTTSRNVTALLNNWVLALNDLDDGNTYDVCHFSLNEMKLSVQSTYFFLSKTGCKVRETHFPINGADMWKYCDVIITANGQIVKSKPKGKIVVLIATNDNKKYAKKADLVYENILDVINDTEFTKKISSNNVEQKINIFKRIKNKIVKYIKK